MGFRKFYVKFKFNHTEIVGEFNRFKEYEESEKEVSDVEEYIIKFSDEEVICDILTIKDKIKSQCENDIYENVNNIDIIILTKIN